MRKINLKGASYDSVFLAVSKVLTMAFGIVLSKILSVGLSLEDYGTYSQANLITSIGTSLILLGLGDAVNYYYNKRDKNIDDSLRHRVVNTVFFIELLFGIILAILIIAGQNMIVDYFSNPSLKILIPIISLIPMLGNIIYFYQVLYVSVNKAKMMAVYNLIIIIVKIISAYIAVYVIKNILWIFVVIVALDILLLLIYNLSLRRTNVRINYMKIAPEYIKPIFAYGLPMGIYAMTSTISRDVDKLVIGRLADTETMAIYSNCSKILPFDFLVAAFATVLIPYIVKYVTEGNKEESVKLFSMYMKIGYYSVWLLGAAVLIAPEAVISFIYAEEYVVGKAVFVIYILDSMLRFASMHLILTAASKTKTLMLYSLASLALNFILNIVFYYMWGPIGPAVATLITSLLYTWAILGKTIKVIDSKWKEIFNVKEILIFVISLVCIWIPSNMLYRLLNHLGMNHHLSMIIAMMIFCLISFAIHLKKIFSVLREINKFRL